MWISLMYPTMYPFSWTVFTLGSHTILTLVSKTPHKISQLLFKTNHYKLEIHFYHKDNLLNKVTILHCHEPATTIWCCALWPAQRQARCLPPAVCGASLFSYHLLLGWWLTQCRGIIKVTTGWSKSWENLFYQKKIHDCKLYIHLDFMDLLPT